ncbi:MAG TPA: nucleotide exchange factor GrpE [Planctomycetota bacterium]|nr:nucleotide exchange factor GrpE [Planctomycetota bacterium]
MVEKKHGKREVPDGTSEDTTEPAEASPDAEASETVGIEELQARSRQRDEFLDLLQRTRAEFSNYRKRIERERLEWTERAVGGFVTRLLPVLDDFDRALAHADEAVDLRAFVDGVRLLKQNIDEVLRSIGVEPFEPDPADPFDPACHEAMTVEITDELPDQTVSEVLLKGYRLHDRVLRPAQVKVARSTPPESEEAPSQDPTDVQDAGEEEDTSDADV